MTLPFKLDEALWRFDTRNLTVAFFATPEDMDPADSFTSGEDIEAVRSGSVEWFTAWVVVYDDLERVLAYDVLGGCAYNSFREFYTSHRKYRQGDYFTDMVKCAISEARKDFCDRPFQPYRIRCAV